jgi:hypothetical protein
LKGYFTSWSRRIFVNAPFGSIMGKNKLHRIPLDLRALGGREEIFRISQGLRKNPAVDIWLNDETADLRSIAQKWFAQMRQCGDDVLELMHDGCPVACIEDAPFAYVNTFKSHVNVGFFNGATLSDPMGLLEGSGKRMRHVKLKPGSEFNTADLGKLVEAAYLDMKVRLGAERASRKT